MNMLVLGNGFDLAHNLPTRYTNFLEYVIKQRDLGEVEHTRIYELIQKKYMDRLFCSFVSNEFVKGYKLDRF